MRNACKMYLSDRLGKIFVEQRRRRRCCDATMRINEPGTTDLRRNTLCSGLGWIMMRNISRAIAKWDFANKFAKQIGDRKNCYANAASDNELLNNTFELMNMYLCNELLYSFLRICVGRLFMISVLESIVKKWHDSFERKSKFRTTYNSY